MNDVHTQHCCVNRHHCKYDDKECTVMTGKARGEYECEDCTNDDIEYRSDDQYPETD